MALPEIKELIKGKVTFQYYRQGNLWYVAENGTFTFPVPISDIGEATFMNTDKAMLFMRYIRKQLAVLKEAQTVNAADQS